MKRYSLCAAMTDHDIDIRVIHVSRTFADIAGLPLERNEVAVPLKLQKLEERVHRHFGEVHYDVIPPMLLPHQSGKVRFPRYEIIAGIFGSQEVIVFYVDSLSNDLENLIVQEIAKRSTQPIAPADDHPRLRAGGRI